MLELSIKNNEKYKNIDYIIHNKSVTPKYIERIILILCVLTFVAGFFAGFVYQNIHVYNSIENLIQNNGLLLFDGNYYRFLEVPKDIVIEYYR